MLNARLFSLLPYCTDYLYTAGTRDDEGWNERIYECEKFLEMQVLRAIDDIHAWKYGETANQHYVGSTSHPWAGGTCALAQVEMGEVDDGTKDDQHVCHICDDTELDNDDWRRGADEESQRYAKHATDPALAL